jgi:hypothetical protein
MQFQPGQSGNPGGRPLGARNKKTLAMEAVIDKKAEEALELIMRRARGGDPTCLRLLIERVVPTGTNRPLALELPKVQCADDAQVAFNMVIEAFGRGAITVREFSPMLGSVDRMARVAERIQQNREKERERYKGQRVHGIHPDMIPKPTGETGRAESILAAIERGEDPFPDEPGKSAYVLHGEGQYSPVNFGECGPAPLPIPEGPACDALYSPVNSDDESLPPRAQASEGEGGSPERSEGESGGGKPVISDQEKVIKEEARVSDRCSLITDHCATPTPDPSAPRAARGEGNPEATADSPEEAALYSPVNSGASAEESLAPENRPTLPDGSRLVAALATTDRRREPLYLEPSSMLLDPDPLAEIMRVAESAANDAERLHVNPR